MRIVIDLQGAQAPGSRRRGIGRYSIALTKAIVRNRGDHELHLVLNGSFPDSVGEIRDGFRGQLPHENIHVFFPVTPTAQVDPANTGRRRASEDLREIFIRKLEPDVVHIASLFEGMHDDVVCSIRQLHTDIPTSVSLYDLIPFLNKELYLQDPVVASWYMERLGQLRRADAWLAISESARQEAINSLGIPRGSAVNIGTAADPQFESRDISKDEEQALRARYGLFKPFVMYTGGIDPRKNIEALIRSYANLPSQLRRAHQLAIVCSVLDTDRQRLLALAKGAGLNEGELIMTGFVPEDDLIALYNLTSLFVFPSLHEGFGLPALEAMHCGAPVIASDRSSLPEVVDLPEALFNPYDERAMTASIAKALNDEVFRTTLKANSDRQAKAFSWDDCGRKAIAAFEQMFKVATRPTPSVGFRRPRLAYVSPMPPAKSGIANYTADLLPHLSRFYEIDAIVKDNDVRQVDITAAPFGAQIVSESDFRARASSYDRILYQFGNSDHHDHMFSLLEQTGGVVVLHDFFLSGILAHLEWAGHHAGAWAAELYRSHGYPALLFRKNAPEEVDALWEFPCSRSVVEAADCVIVHSNYSMRLAQRWYGDDLAKRFTIIPHLREPVIGSIEKSAARQKLGLDAADFVVCSFGFISPTKLSQRLLDAWSNAELRDDTKAKLIFVGENHPGDYGDELQRRIDSFPHKSAVSIAGWTDTQTFRTYLAAADVAVQLRTLSRGETSGAVLDCMNYGVPLIVNANGSMADLQPEAAIILPEEFSTAQLAGKLDELRCSESTRVKMSVAARRIIAEEHSPSTCAAEYMRTIERSSLEASFVSRLAADADVFSLSPTELGQLSREVSQLEFDQGPRLLVDISELAASDAGSGIQRVVRNILMQLLTDPNPAMRVEPIYTDPHTREFRFARVFTAKFLGVDIGDLGDDVVDITSRDTLLLLDLNPIGVPIVAEKIAAAKCRGAKCVYVVYDLLTVKHPEFFLPDAASYYRRWLEYVGQASGAICISQTVAQDLREYFDETDEAKNLQIGHFPLGTDLDSYESKCAGKEPIGDFDVDFSKPTFLMVGTIEPRKKHAEALDAFEALWASGEDVNLCVIGKEGWMVADVVARMATLDRRANQFVWRTSISDDQLAALYEKSNCLIAASADEGYGLPLVEGAARGLHIIARDIPVFREVCGESATYFSDDLTTVIRSWLANFRSGDFAKVRQLETFTWRQSTEALLQAIASIRP